jgi:hypothetical protein
MATYAGKGGAMTSQASGGSATSVLEIRDYSFTITQNSVPDTVLGDDFESHKATTGTFTATVNCIYDDTDAGQEIFVPGTDVGVVFFPAGNSTGKEKFTGTAYIQEESTNVSVDGLVERTFTLAGQGTGLTKATV